MGITNLIIVAFFQCLEGLAFGDVGMNASDLARSLLVLSLHELLELLALEFDPLAHDLLLLFRQFAREHIVLPHRCDRAVMVEQLLGVAGTLGVVLGVVLLQLLLLPFLPLLDQQISQVVTRDRSLIFLDGHRRSAIFPL